MHTIINSNFTPPAGCRWGLRLMFRGLFLRRAASRAASIAANSKQKIYDRLLAAIIRPCLSLRRTVSMRMATLPGSISRACVEIRHLPKGRAGHRSIAPFCFAMPNAAAMLRNEPGAMRGQTGHREWELPAGPRARTGIYRGNARLIAMCETHI